MTVHDEQALHRLAQQLAKLTEGTGWEALRYAAIGRTLEQMTEYCATCACQVARNWKVAQR